MTAFLGITGAVKSALAAAPAIVDGGVQRGRRGVLPENRTSNLTINAPRHVAKQLDLEGKAQQWESLVQVELRVRAKPDVDAEAAIDPLLSAVWDRLAALTLPAGVVSATLEPALAVDFDELDYTVAVATLSLRVVHITAGGALSA